MMYKRVYLASRFDRRLEMQGKREELARLGFTVTSRWLDETGLDGTDEFDRNRKLARIDLEDVARANILIAFTEAPDVPGAGRGGRHVEFGYALAHSKTTILVGPTREHIFHYLANYRCEDWPATLALLGALEEWSK